MINKILKLKNSWPIFLIAFIAWYSYILWINHLPEVDTLSSSIEAKDIVLSSKVTGRVQKIYIDEGSQVKKGDFLLELESNDLLARRDQAQEALKKSRFELKDLIKGAREQEVLGAEAISKSTLASLEQAKSKYAEIALDLNRYKRLYEDGASSKQTLDRYITSKAVIEKQISELEEKYKSSREKESLIKAGPRKDQVSALRSAVKVQEKKLEELNTLVSELQIKAPFDGEVSSFDLEVGELISANTPILTISDLKDLSVRVYISANSLSKIMLNQEINLVADSYPEKVFTGTVTYISPKSEFTPRNIQTPEKRTKLVYPVKINIKNDKKELRDGMFITAKI